MKITFVEKWRGNNAGDVRDVFDDDSIAAALRLADDGIVTLDGKSAAAQKSPAKKRASSEKARKAKAETTKQLDAVEETAEPPQPEG